MANWANTGNVGDPLSPGWQEKNLQWIEPVKGQRWQVYKQAAPAFEGLLTDLAKLGYTPTSSGGFNYRNIRGGDRLSQHAFGTAIDINALANQLGQSTTDIPQAAQLAAKYGLEWGGNWKGRPDPMHFEYAGQGFTPDPSVAVASATPDAAATPAAPTVSQETPQIAMPEKKPDSWQKRLGEGLAGAGIGDAFKSAPVTPIPPQPQAAMAATAPTPIIDPNQAERQRQAMAVALARLNSGQLWGAG